LRRVPPASVRVMTPGSGGAAAHQVPQRGAEVELPQLAGKNAVETGLNPVKVGRCVQAKPFEGPPRRLRGRVIPAVKDSVLGRPACLARGFRPVHHPRGYAKVGVEHAAVGLEAPEQSGLDAEFALLRNVVVQDPRLCVEQMARVRRLAAPDAVMQREAGIGDVPERAQAADALVRIPVHERAFDNDELHGVTPARRGGQSSHFSLRRTACQVFMAGLWPPVAGGKDRAGRQPLRVADSGPRRAAPCVLKEEIFGCILSSAPAGMPNGSPPIQTAGGHDSQWDGPSRQQGWPDGCSRLAIPVFWPSAAAAWTGASWPDRRPSSPPRKS